MIKLTRWTDGIIIEKISLHSNKHRINKIYTSEHLTDSIKLILQISQRIHIRALHGVLIQRTQFSTLDEIFTLMQLSLVIKDSYIVTNIVPG